jgi:cyclopropane-fatty-acyl-phospholipid synthase
MSLTDLAERGIIPDRLIRWGIRRQDRERLGAEGLGNAEAQRQALERLIQGMRESPIAVRTEKPKEQHYEVSPEFFQKVLGKRMKYSGCYWPPGVKSLDEAEAAMLALTCDRAQVEDGMEILELGCGWGAVSLWIAEKYPRSRVVAVSNSRPQEGYIKGQCAAKGLRNVEMIRADMNEFETKRRFDRVISVEMFEHMRNWESLLQRIASWLRSNGKLFIHIFSHRQFAYLFEEGGKDNWMGRYFFTEGLMPSDDLLYHFQDHLAVEAHWRVDGTHYQKTAEAWLANMDRQKRDILPISKEVYGEGRAARWFQRWRIFFMACAELWGYGKGNEWLVSHYRLIKRDLGGMTVKPNSW